MGVTTAMGLANVLASRNYSFPLISKNYAFSVGGNSETRTGLGQFRVSTRPPLSNLHPSVHNVLKSSRTRSARLRINCCQFSTSATSAAADFTVYDVDEDINETSKFVQFLTSERAKVLLMISLALSLCNAHRMVMSVAIAPLQDTYGWNSSFAGVVQSSFLWGYLLSPVPGGTFADCYGGKIVLAIGLAIWSLTTLLTPLSASHSVGTLLAVRTVFGIAQGVAFPCMNTLITSWFPCTERATAVGLAMVGFHLGNVISLLVTPLLMSCGDIPMPFCIFGILGFLWLSTWVTRIYDDPQDHPRISKSELLHIQDQPQTDTEYCAYSGPPFRLLFSKLATWAIIVANFTNNWGYFVLLSWMPVYFKTVFDVNLKQAAWFSAVPWMMMAFTSYIAGAFSDMLIQQGYTVTFVRKFMQSVGFIGPGLALIALNYAPDPTAASAWFTAALGLSAFSQAGFLLNIQDIAPQHSGVLNGITNGIGTLAAIVGTAGTGCFVQWCGSFQPLLYLTASMYFLSTVFWNLYCTGERVF